MARGQLKPTAMQNLGDGREGFLVPVSTIDKLTRPLALARDRPRRKSGTLFSLNLTGEYGKLHSVEKSPKNETKTGSGRVFTKQNYQTIWCLSTLPRLMSRVRVSSPAPPSLRGETAWIKALRASLHHGKMAEGANFPFWLKTALSIVWTRMGGCEIDNLPNRKA